MRASALIAILRQQSQEIGVDQQRAFSINQICELLGVGRDGVYCAIRQGRFKARKIGRRTVVLGCDLTAFLDGLPALELVQAPNGHQRTSSGVRQPTVPGR